MISAQEYIHLELSPCSKYLYLQFNRNTERTVYDICDIHGRILKSGTVEDDRVKISLGKLENNHYVVLVLDGDRVYNRKFTLRR